MIFLTLLVVGAIAGWLTSALRGARTRQEVAYGACGAFLLGGLAAGLAERPLAAFDPIVVALGAVGAVGAALLGEVLERGASGPGAGRPKRSANRADRHRSAGRPG